MKLIRTPHQKRPCQKCETNAMLYNHCSFCGGTFPSLTKLSNHLDTCRWYAEVFGRGE